MVEVAEYEKRGDLEEPFELTKTAQRAQQKAERIKEATTCTMDPSSLGGLHRR